MSLIYQKDEPKVILKAKDNLSTQFVKHLVERRHSGVLETVSGVVRQVYADSPSDPVRDLIKKGDKPDLLKMKLTNQASSPFVIKTKLSVVRNSKKQRSTSY